MWIKNYVINIIVLVLISAILEVLMPENHLKKHISLVTGLVILLYIVKPIISIKGFSFDAVSWMNEITANSVSVNIYEKLEKEQYDITDDKFEEAISDNLTESVKNQFSVNPDIKVNAEKGEVKNVIISSEENKSIQDYIKNTYGLSCIFTGE